MRWIKRKTYGLDIEIVRRKKQHKFVYVHCPFFRTKILTATTVRFHVSSNDNVLTFDYRIMHNNCQTKTGTLMQAACMQIEQANATAASEVAELMRRQLTAGRTDAGRS